MKLKVNDRCLCGHMRRDHWHGERCIEDGNANIIIGNDCPCDMFRFNNLAYLEKKYDDKLRLSV